MDYEELSRFPSLRLRLRLGVLYRDSGGTPDWKERFKDLKGMGAKNDRFQT